MNLFTKQKQTHRHRKQTCGYQRGKGMGRDKLGVWDQQIQTTIYEINNKVLLYSTGNYIQYPVINHNGKEYEEEYVYIYVQVNHSAVHQKLTQHCKSTILQFKQKTNDQTNKKPQVSLSTELIICVNLCISVKMRAMRGSTVSKSSTTGHHKLVTLFFSIYKINLFIYRFFL